GGRWVCGGGLGAAAVVGAGRCGGDGRGGGLVRVSPTAVTAARPDSGRRASGVTCTVRGENGGRPGPRAGSLPTHGAQIAGSGGFAGRGGGDADGLRDGIACGTGATADDLHRRLGADPAAGHARG